MLISFQNKDKVLLWIGLSNYVKDIPQSFLSPPNQLYLESACQRDNFAKMCSFDGESTNMIGALRERKKINDPVTGQEAE